MDTADEIIETLEAGGHVLTPEQRAHVLALRPMTSEELTAAVAKVEADPSRW